MTEVWKAVPGYAGRYEVSDLGRVRSLRFRGHDNVQVMTSTRNYAGYHVVTLGSDRKQHRVPCVVLEAFVGPRPDGMQACHGPDHNRDNNQLGNLRWDTMDANLAERMLPRDEQHHNAVLTRQDKLEIARRRKAGEYLKHIAKDYGVSLARVSQIDREFNTGDKTEA